MQGVKQCKHCGEWKNITNFEKTISRSGKSYRRNRCGSCTRMKKVYNLEWKDKQDMLRNQNGVCAICKEDGGSRGLVIDHCHASGKVRKLLCNRCNLVLGQVGDNVRLLEQAILYLS